MTSVSSVHKAEHPEPVLGDNLDGQIGGEGVGRQVQGWGTHVHLWPIHADVWQKPSKHCNYPLIKINELIFKNKRKKKKRKIAGRNINNLRYTDGTTLMAESEEELKSPLMKLKEGSEKSRLKTQHSKN